MFRSLFRRLLTALAYVSRVRCDLWRTRHPLPGQNADPLSSGLPANVRAFDSDATTERFRDWVRDAKYFDHEKWPGNDRLPIDEKRVADLRNLLTALSRRESFIVGDIVKWKRGLCPYEAATGLMIVSRFFTPKQAKKRAAAHGYFGSEPDDVILMAMGEDGRAYELAAESRRLTKIASTNGHGAARERVRPRR
jgi:hypothetical protein